MKDALATLTEMTGFFGVVFAVVAVLSIIPAWITHCATLIARLADGNGDSFWNAVLLVIGALFAPIGVVHGWMIWLGLA
jgi:hypothetical protein